MYIIMTATTVAQEQDRVLLLQLEKGVGLASTLPLSAELLTTLPNTER